MNRAFVYGDLIFETIKVVKGEVCLGLLHYNRLLASAQLLHMEIELAYETFESIVLDAAQKLGRDEVRVRLVLHRNATGFYTPANNQTAIETDVFPHEKPTSLHVGIYNKTYKPCHFVSNLKSGNALVYTLAGIWAKEHQFDDALLLNEHGHICEATSSNVFCVLGNKVLTPSLTEGCVAGVMREWLLTQLQQSNYTVEEGVVTTDQFNQADAIYLTNAIYGIRRVQSINGKTMKLYDSSFPFS